jgi:hypothetical protein
MDYSAILEDARRDPALLSTINVDELLSSINTDSQTDYLTGQTLTSISSSIFDSVLDKCLDPSSVCSKLKEYRLVDEIYQLHRGKYIRWLRDGSLSSGGIVLDIKFLDNGIHVLCKNNMSRFIQYRFDEVITFQKLSAEEMLVLMIQ